MYKSISDYGLIGDMHAIALVSRDGSIDYCSMPHIDSPTVFAAILDEEKGGFFSIQPKLPFKSEQRYIKDTNILSCTFKTETGEAELIDFMPVTQTELFKKKEHAIHRCLRVKSGSIEFNLRFYPRPQYALGIPKIEKTGNLLEAKFRDEIFVLVLKLKKFDIKVITDSEVEISFKLNGNQDAHFDFIFGEKGSTEIEECKFNQTQEFWLSWLKSCIGDRCLYWGQQNDMVNRSLLALKLLTFQPTGAIAAAATTSLPEAVGAERNWDYRFTWIRDASFTLKAMFTLGHISEADSFVRWLHETYRKYGSKNLQIMYSLTGENKLTEKTLDHLKGYKNSRPVRIGNNAYNQRQWDIYGEVMDTAFRLSDYAGKVDETLWPFFRDICNLALQNWNKPDEGIWEVRNGPFHFVYSKVMCWVALDRGIKIARRYGFDAPISKWENERDRIKREILEKGYDKDLESFVQRYGSKDLDSSLLLLPLMNFLPISDHRIQNTIEACIKNLMRNGFLLRYSSSDGLEGEEGTFLLCNFWLIECLALSGRIEDGQELLQKTTQASNHLGLFSEEYDFKNRELLGNFPQAFSHIGYLNAISAIYNVQKKMSRKKAYLPLIDRMRRLIPIKVVLNKTNKEISGTSKDIAQELKISLNMLQGAFFDVYESRVNYDSMKHSESFKKYISLAEKLNAFNPYSLKTDKDKKAFWINIYNILIIHGVIDFNITRSVKEVINFFGRIGYNIGGLFFSPDDIEHGILRSNRPHPVSGQRQFVPSDKRSDLAVKEFDFRIHFALVCAASSCPPIEFYDAANIDKQLDVATKSFIKRRGVVFNKGTLYLSQIFAWYASDFGKNQKNILNKMLPFLNTEEQNHIERNRDELKIKHLPYDWNLNKTLK